MADDIIDSMFKTFIQLIGWIFKKLFQLVWWIISSIFKFIWSLISGNKKDSANSQSVGVSSKTVGKLYTDAKITIDNWNINSSSIADLEETTNEIISLFANEIMTNGILTVKQKCELLTHLNHKLQQGSMPKFYNLIFCNIIEFSYKLLESVVPSPILLQGYDKFKQELSQNSVIDFTTYFAEIFCASGLLGSPNGQFNMKHSIFEQYELPKYLEDE